MQEMHVIISGNVQGVGFRAAAKREAEKLRITGYACNLQDGTVEILAQGSKDNLDALLKNLQVIFSKHIEKIHVRTQPVSSKLDFFALK